MHGGTTFIGAGPTGTTRSGTGILIATGTIGDTEDGGGRGTGLHGTHLIITHGTASGIHGIGIRGQATGPAT